METATVRFGRAQGSLRSAVMAGLMLGARLLCMGQTAEAGSLRVENYGTDGPGCGLVAPCRSINQAIANAIAGDKIKVGPGLYSDDLDADSVFAEPGEEPATGIAVDRAVALESTDGASATVVRYVHSGINVFDVTAHNVRVGKKSKGFTISLPDGGGAVGLEAGVSNVAVEGNLAILWPSGGGASLLFWGVLNDGVVFRNNKVIGHNPTGCVGFLATGTNILLDGNVVMGCQIGFDVGNGVTLTRNVAIDNYFGFQFGGTSGGFTDNAAIGNAAAGVVVALGLSPISITGNSFFGNGVTGTNCGLRNASGTAVVAPDDFWGSSAGPGPDPADDVCNDVGSSTSTSPPAIKDQTPLLSSQR
jgi:hypothetical protein